MVVVVVVMVVLAGDCKGVEAADSEGSMVKGKGWIQFNAGTFLGCESKKGRMTLFCSLDSMAQHDAVRGHRWRSTRFSSYHRGGVEDYNIAK